MRFILFGLTVLWAAYSLAQSPSLTYTKELKYPKKTEPKKFLHEEDGEHFVLVHEFKAFGGSNFLYKYDEEMNLLKSAPLNFKEGKKRVFFEDLYFMDDKIWQVDMFYNGKDNTRYYFALEIDRESLLPKSGRKKIADFKFGSILNRTDNDSTVTFFQTEDRKHLGVLTSSEEPDANKEVFKLAVYDKNMEPVHEATVNLGVSNGSTIVHDLLVDNTGACYVLTEKDISSDPDASSSFCLRKYEKGASKAECIEVKFAGKTVSEYQLALKEDGTVYFAGYYSKVESKTQDGIFFAIIDTKAGLVDMTDYAFDNDITATFYRIPENIRSGDFDRPKNPVEGKKFVVRKLAITPEGIYLVGEIFYAVAAANSPSESSSSELISYTYADILVSKITADGTLEWVRRISKTQSSFRNVFSGFVMINEGKNVHLIYNHDPIVPEGEELTRKEKYNQEAILVETINEAGEVNKRHLVFNPGELTRTIIHLFGQDENGKHILYVRRDRKEGEDILRFANLDF